MDEAERELFVRLERERTGELHRRQRERHERRRRALERPEARAEWDRLAAEELMRDVLRQAPREEWVRFLREVAVQAHEAGEPLPDFLDLAVLRKCFLARVALDEAEGYVGLLDVDDELLQTIAEELLAEEPN